MDEDKARELIRHGLNSKPYAGRIEVDTSKGYWEVKIVVGRNERIGDITARVAEAVKWRDELLDQEEHHRRKLREEAGATSPHDLTLLDRYRRIEHIAHLKENKGMSLGDIAEEMNGNLERLLRSASVYLQQRNEAIALVGPIPEGYDEDMEIIRLATAYRDPSESLPASEKRIRAIVDDWRQTSSAYALSEACEWLLALGYKNEKVEAKLLGALRNIERGHQPFTLDNEGVTQWKIRTVLRHRKNKRQGRVDEYKEETKRVLSSRRRIRSKR